MNNLDVERTRDFISYFLDAYINKDTDLELSYTGFIDFMNNENPDDEEEWDNIDLPKEVIISLLKDEVTKAHLDKYYIRESKYYDERRPSNIGDIEYVWHVDAPDRSDEDFEDEESANEYAFELGLDPSDVVYKEENSRYSKHYGGRG